MKIALYCQHVLGIGHLFRSLALCRALHRHDVVLITGGKLLDVPLPRNVRHLQLPALMMDAGFGGLINPHPTATLDEIKQDRRQQLWRFFQTEAPDIFVLELYPFGRKAFRFELDPVLEGLRDGRLSPAPVVCSLRDVLVEKSDYQAYQTRVIRTVNRYFDAILVHADAALLRLDETFEGVARIAVPMLYTGFVAPRPTAGARARIRKGLKLRSQDRLVVASGGGGRVAAPLLKAVAAAQRHLSTDRRIHLHLFTGPYLPAEDYDDLYSRRTERVRIERFSPDFLDFLAAADLSVSMGGYNTCMNILAAGVSALVWPFAQNREQGLRARRLARRGCLEILTDQDLEPGRLAVAIQRGLGCRAQATSGIDLQGAETTARWIEAHGPAAKG